MNERELRAHCAFEIPDELLPPARQSPPAVAGEELEWLIELAVEGLNRAPGCSNDTCAVCRGWYERAGQLQELIQQHYPAASVRVARHHMHVQLNPKETD